MLRLTLPVEHERLPANDRYRNRVARSRLELLVMGMDKVGRVLQSMRFIQPSKAREANKIVGHIEITRLESVSMDKR